ncbi:MAG: hypothetical protein JKY87_06650 [Mariprofundus sp.]|nr:hypothetical protein [Mariprofundus sp.]
MNDVFCVHDTFNPFGDGVRIGGHSVAGDTEISANLKDLCDCYSVDYDKANALHIPMAQSSCCRLNVIL